jgi:hypothetical protein
MIAPFRYVMELDALDAGRALFRHRNPGDSDDSRASLALNRDQWQDLGKPSALLVTLEEAERAR